MPAGASSTSAGVHWIATAAGPSAGVLASSCQQVRALDIRSNPLNLQKVHRFFAACNVEPSHSTGCATSLTHATELRRAKAFTLSNGECIPTRENPSCVSTHTMKAGSTKQMAEEAPDSLSLGPVRQPRRPYLVLRQLSLSISKGKAARTEAGFTRHKCTLSATPHQSSPLKLPSRPQDVMNSLCGRNQGRILQSFSACVAVAWSVTFFLCISFLVPSLRYRCTVRHHEKSSGNHKGIILSMIRKVSVTNHQSLTKSGNSTSRRLQQSQQSSATKPLDSPFL